MKKIILANLILIILISGCNSNNSNVGENLSKCIGEKSILYISNKCVACQKQEKMFEENFKHLNVVDCVLESEKCRDAEITKVPTWIINGEKFEGVQSIEKLKELTNC